MTTVLTILIFIGYLIVSHFENKRKNKIIEDYITEVNLLNLHILSSSNIDKMNEHLKTKNELEEQIKKEFIK
jgi:hypothetical protein